MKQSNRHKITLSIEQTRIKVTISPKGKTTVVNLIEDDVRRDNQGEKLVARYSCMPPKSED